MFMADDLLLVDTRKVKYLSAEESSEEEESGEEEASSGGEVFSETEEEAEEEGEEDRSNRIGKNKPCAVWKYLSN